VETLLLSESDILEVLTMRDVIECCDRTFQGFGQGTTINPTKVTLDLGENAPYPAYEGFMNAMPAYIGWQDTAGMKWVGGFLGERRKRGLSYIVGMILLIDPRLGIFKAALDGSLITNWRTGAQTAVALKYLKQHKKSLKIGLYGAGMQGRTQTMAISEVFDISELKVYDIRKEAALDFAKSMQSYVKGDIIVCESPEQVTVSADAVISVTQAQEPYIKKEWIEPGTIVFPMGSYQECEDQVILDADVIVVDHVGQALHRGALKHLVDNGELSEQDITATIGDLSIGKKRVEDIEGKKVICVPIGTGAMDISVAQFVLDRATEKGLGGKFDFLPSYQTAQMTL
jgi:ornithine cyclodeaminase/alanine dehydrogenase